MNLHTGLHSRWPSWYYFFSSTYWDHFLPRTFAQVSPLSQMLSPEQMSSHAGFFIMQLSVYRHIRGVFQLSSIQVKVLSIPDIFCFFLALIITCCRLLFCLCVFHPNAWFLQLFSGSLGPQAVTSPSKHSVNLCGLNEWIANQKNESLLK